MDGKGQRSTSPEKVKENILCLIRLKGMTETGTAKKAGIAEGYFSAMKQSVGYPDLSKLLKICEALNTPIEDVLYKDWRNAMEQKEIAEIDKEIVRLKKRREELSGKILKRTKERIAAQEKEE